LRKIILDASQISAFLRSLDRCKTMAYFLSSVPLAGPLTEQQHSRAIPSAIDSVRRL
jgi:hypothetical protein